ncbi:MAG: caspase family protein [Bacteroidetes bacterium]|nr:caspase family protein [Bacteroidota bacterium]MCL2302233.1 caspase family protein [Lentimicrobiaceae bacterium]MCL2302313.1 caspase family protein [Lentimicrobiaceae bacterium]
MKKILFFTLFAFITTTTFTQTTADRTAAEKGNANAQFNLGWSYYNGEGVEADPILALYWFKKALSNEKPLSYDLVAYAEARVKESEICLPDQFSIFAKDFVQTKINEWQQKGEYEKTEDWQKRISENARNEKINMLTKEAEDVFLTLKYEEVELTLEKYDPDNEVYLITSDLYGNLLVPVPHNEAQTFRNNWNSYTKKPKYFIENDGLALAEVVFSAQGSKSYKYSNQASLNYIIAHIDYNFAPVDISGNPNSQRGNQNINTVNLNIGKSDVDINIPVTDFKNDKTFVVIIANENYHDVSKVDFAISDGITFREYCIKTLGIPAQNISFKTNATLNNMRAEINWIRQVAEQYKGEANIIFYYAGHGIPDENSRSSYLLPVDGYGTDVTTGYKLDDLYKILGDLPAQSVTVFMDACFSGAGRDGQMLAQARGVRITAKSGVPTGNMVVFSSSQGDETSFPYKEKGHGLFTYFLLKKLQETKGDVTLGELSDYLTIQVGQQSILVNRKSQTPTVTASATMGNNWKELKLK